MRESTDYALVWSLVSVVGKLGPSIGARTRAWAEVKVRPRPLCERAQARRQNEARQDLHVQHYDLRETEFVLGK